MVTVHSLQFHGNHPSPPIIHLLRPILDFQTILIGDFEEQIMTREPGALFSSELWWRDHYHVLENSGYRLRPRYRPDWVPCWKKLGKPFYTAEDGQPTLVSATRLISFMPKIVLATCIDGRNAQGWNACDAEEGYCEKGTAGIERSPKCFLCQNSGASPRIIVYHC